MAFTWRSPTRGRTTASGAGDPTTDTIPDPWSVREEAFPATADAATQLRFLLNYAVLAPSGHNTQPWRFGVDGPEVWLYADTARALPVVDPDHRELTISCGAALFHLRMSIRRFGFVDEVDLLPRPDETDLLARVRIGARRAASEEERLLFSSMKLRRTYRPPFRADPVADPVLSRLEHAAGREGASLYLVRDPQVRNAVADLIAQGDVVQMADRRFRAELAAWMRRGRGRTRDGIPGHALGLGALSEYMMAVTRFTVRAFDMGTRQAHRDRELALRSPVMAVFGTEEDSTPAWLSAGQALARILLRARSEGVCASFLNQRSRSGSCARNSVPPWACAGFRNCSFGWATQIRCRRHRAGRYTKCATRQPLPTDVFELPLLARATKVVSIRGPRGFV